MMPARNHDERCDFPDASEAALVNPAIGPVPATPIELRVERGLTLPGRVWASGSPRALIAIAHGIGEHSGRYAALAADLVRARHTVVAIDWPGHGEAPGSRGDIRSWSWLRDRIVPAMFTASRGLPGQPEELPHILLGHSMGGVLALDFAVAHPRSILGVVASAPALRSAMPPWWKLMLANVARATAPSVGFPTGIESGGISRDPEVLRARDADPLVHGRISPRLFHEFNEARQRVLRDARRLAAPALVMHGDADAVANAEGSREFAAAAPRGLVKLVIWPDAYHEIFNDHGRDERVRETITWMDSLLARRG
jgi:alpha-beta hydrolase superfamily lysophospholipase